MLLSSEAVVKVDEAVGKSNKRKRSVLNIADKVRIISAVSNGEKPVDVARRTGVASSTVSNILANKRKYLEAWQRGTPDAKALKTPKYDQLDSALFEWYKIQRAQNVPISGVLLLEKARVFADQMGLTDFKASNGFLDRFKTRHAVQFRSPSGKLSAINSNGFSWIREVLPTLIEGFDEHDIFVMDEMSLFYKALPEETTTLKGESCVAGERSAERLTLALFVNMDGSDMMKPIVVGNSADPRNLDSEEECSRIDYYSNAEAWMTAEIWADVISRFDELMSSQERRVVLFIDNVASHAYELKDTLKATTIYHFPSNLTGIVQPFDRGITQSFKLRYRTDLVRQFITFPVAADFSFSLLDALNLISEKWRETDASFIRNCFCESGFGAIDLASMKREPALSHGNTFEELQALLATGFPTVDPMAYATIDEDVYSERLLTDQEILQQFLRPAQLERDEQERDEHESQEDEEANDTQTRKVTFHEAWDALQVVKRYAEQQGLAIDLFPLEEALLETRFSKTQKSDEDFSTAQASSCRRLHEEDVGPSASSICCICGMTCDAPRICLRCVKNLGAICISPVEDTGLASLPLNLSKS